MRRFTTGIIVALLCVSLAGCGSRSLTTEQTLVDLAKQYVDFLAKKSFKEIVPMCTGDQLAAMENALPVLEAASLAVETKIQDWQGKCDFMNRDKTRGSVTATYTQLQTIKDVGTVADEFSTVYEFAKVADSWRIYSVKIIRKTPVK